MSGQRKVDAAGIRLLHDTGEQRLSSATDDCCCGDATCYYLTKRCTSAVADYKVPCQMVDDDPDQYFVFKDENGDCHRVSDTYNQVDETDPHPIKTPNTIYDDCDGCVGGFYDCNDIDISMCPETYVLVAKYTREFKWVSIEDGEIYSIKSIVTKTGFLQKHEGNPGYWDMAEPVSVECQCEGDYELEPVDLSNVWICGDESGSNCGYFAPQTFKIHCLDYFPTFEGALWDLTSTYPFEAYAANVTLFYGRYRLSSWWMKYPIPTDSPCPLPLTAYSYEKTFDMVDIPGHISGNVELEITVS